VRHGRSGGAAAPTQSRRATTPQLPLAYPAPGVPDVHPHPTTRTRAGTPPISIRAARRLPRDSYERTAPATAGSGSRPAACANDARNWERGRWRRSRTGPPKEPAPAVIRGRRPCGRSSIPEPGRRSQPTASNRNGAGPPPDAAPAALPASHHRPTRRHVLIWHR
jgi:hypothetical protein